MRIGIDLGGTKIAAIVMDKHGQIRAQQRIPAPQNDYVATLHAITTLIQQLENTVGHSRIGICTPGAPSKMTGRMKNCNSTWLNGQKLQKDLEQHLQRDIRIANDADCFTLSEATDGAAAHANTVFGVILGTGVGGGIVINRTHLSGPNAIAGEWGHNPLPWPEDHERPGPSCYCGQHGCIETYLSGPGLALDHHQHYQQSLSAQQIAMSDDEMAKNSLERHAQRLARALASVINILDPDAIVLGGGLSNIDMLYQRVPQLWQQWVFSDRVDTQLLPPKYGDASGVRGAAWLWPAD